MPGTGKGQKTILDLGVGRILKKHRNAISFIEECQNLIEGESYKDIKGISLKIGGIDRVHEQTISAEFRWSGKTFAHFEFRPETGEVVSLFEWRSGRGVYLGCADLVREGWKLIWRDNFESIVIQEIRRLIDILDIPDSYLADKLVSVLNQTKPNSVSYPDKRKYHFGGANG